MPLAPVVYHKGNVRLLHPVVLPDEHPMTVFYDEPAPQTVATKPAFAPVAAVSKDRPPAVYPEDYPDLGEDTYEYVSPPKPTQTVMTTFEFIEPHAAPQVPEE